MVTDLQGVGCYLTDPVIHSEDLRFNKSGDMGNEGMLGFFSRHKCNNLCMLLNLNKINYEFID